MRITDKYILFWGGKLSKFSNFCPCIINYEGNIFYSSEQLYMYFKAKTFCDADSVRAICEAESPLIAKELWQQVKNYDDDIWAAEREKYMDIVLYEKFTQNEEMYNELMRAEYRDKHFVEASPEDIIWGIGLHFDDPTADDEANWLGQNLLGKCLDRVRDRLLAEGKRPKERIEIEQLYFIDDDNTPYYELIAKHHRGDIRMNATINSTYYSKGKKIPIDVKYKIIKRNYDDNGERYYTEQKGEYSTEILANGRTVFSFDFDQETLNCHSAILCLSVEYEGEGKSHIQHDFRLKELPKDYRELLNITEVRIFRNKVFSDNVYLK